MTGLPIRQNSLTELAPARAYHEVGSFVRRSHVADEVHHLKHGQGLVCLELLGYGCAVVFAGLPDELHAAFLHEVEVLQHAFVHGARSEAATYE